jgi:hypothetical protein
MIDVGLDAIIESERTDIKRVVRLDAVIVRGWLTNFQKQRIGTGRDWMDEYRANNIIRAQQGKNATEKWSNLILFFQRMQTAGYDYSIGEMMDFFFELSRLMNVQEVGYLTEEDFWANATAEEITEYEGMWK